MQKVTFQTNKKPTKIKQKPPNVSSHAQVHILIHKYSRSEKKKEVWMLSRILLTQKLTEITNMSCISSQVNKTAYAQSARHWSYHLYFNTTCEFPIKIWLETELRYSIKEPMWQKKKKKAPWSLQLVQLHTETDFFLEVCLLISTL